MNDPSGPDGPLKAATIRDVAALAGVSIATVSRVLNARSSVRGETRARVQAAVAQLDFHPSPQARSMRAHAPLIGMIIPDQTPSLYGEEAQMGVSANCRARGYHLVVGAAGPDALSGLEAAQEMTVALNVAGMVLFPPLADDEGVLDLIRRTGVACARLSSHDVPDIPAVGIDEAAAAAAMTDSLIRLGHRRIGFVAGPPEYGVSALRRAGYRKALTAAGLRPDEALMVEGRFDAPSGFAAGRALLAQPQPPTAIFASNDDMALGVMSAAKTAGLRIPQDLSIAGFDDVPAARRVWPPLATIRRPIRLMAAMAADMVFAMLDGGADDAAAAHRVADFQLMMRDSVTAPGGQAAGAAQLARIASS